MGTLAAALAWARRGFPVFPIEENGKEPAYTGDWNDTATVDPDLITRMWTDPVLRCERNYNIGVSCSDMVVVDIDTKEGKDGYNKYLQMGGTFETLVVKTPSGGFHCYFYGPSSTNAPLDKDGVDVRSHRGYVLAPGSVINGNRYEIVTDREMSWVPVSIERLLTAPYQRAEHEADTQIDTPAQIDAAVRFLESTPVAIEGQRGDDVTFQTAARLVREMALSVPTAYTLMRDYWNDRCMPPWDHDELLRKVENAAAYGTADLGRLSPEILYENVPAKIAEPLTVFEQMPSIWGNAVIPAYLPPRPWLVERMLMTGAVTLLMAAGSAGKSSLSLALAAHMALGKDFAGFKARRACKTIVYNGEDDLIEQSRRLAAVCIAYGFDFNEVKNKIFLLSARQLKLTLMTVEGRKPIREETLISQITELASDPDVGMIILDPLVKIHHCDESDNVQMDAVMEVLTDIAMAAKVAVLALHHTSKGGRNEERTGNMDISRGASAIVNAARVAFTLLNASQTDAEEYGLQDDERHTFVRLDDAKMNLALASENAVWFRKEGVRIPSNDIVGVLHHEPLEKNHHHIRIRIARILIQTSAAIGQGSMTLGQAISVCKAEEPLWANKTDTDVRRKLEGMFASEVDIEGRRLQIKRKPDNPKEVMLTIY